MWPFNIRKKRQLAARKERLKALLKGETSSSRLDEYEASEILGALRELEAAGEVRALRFEGPFHHSDFGGGGEGGGGGASGSWGGESSCGGSSGGGSSGGD